MRITSDNFVVRLKKKKEDALEYIISIYMPLVKTIATKILYHTSKSDIDECINDVFLNVWRRAHQFHGDAADFKKWIAMITKYKAIDRYRQFDKQNECELTEQFFPHKASSQPEESILQKEEKNMLLLALSQLGEVDSEIFIMKYYLELSNSEIADYLNLTKAAVDNRLYRGKKVLASDTKLKELLI